MMKLRNVRIIRSRTSEIMDTTQLLKWISLIVLTLQNSSQALLIRYSRVRVKKEMFLSTTAVFWTEIVKLSACLVIVTFQERSLSKCFVKVKDVIMQRPLDTLKVCVPSLIYTVQNNLLYVAVSNLSAATFLVTYQLKILTTAICSVLMLGKALGRFQWLALVVLFSGVSLVQLQEQAEKTQGSTNSPPLSGPHEAAAGMPLTTLLPNLHLQPALSGKTVRSVFDNQQQPNANLSIGGNPLSGDVVPIINDKFILNRNDENRGDTENNRIGRDVPHKDNLAVELPTDEKSSKLAVKANQQLKPASQNPALGLAAALISVFLSGFAGVYFEKILKGADISVWLRNVQLSVLSIPMSMLTMYAKDGDFIRDHGLFYGYDSLVWFVVILYAVGGLSVAVVVKYADNILKGFATSVAILLTCLISVFLFNFHPSAMFLLGMFLVIAAVFLYGRPVKSSSTVSPLATPRRAVSDQANNGNNRLSYAGNSKPDDIETGGFLTIDLDRLGEDSIPSGGKG